MLGNPIFSQVKTKIFLDRFKISSLFDTIESESIANDEQRLGLEVLIP